LNRPKDNAAFVQHQGVALQGKVRLADRIALSKADAVHAVIADHPAPQGIVEIKDKAAFRLAPQRAQHTAYVISVKRLAGHGDRHLGQMPLRGGNQLAVLTVAASAATSSRTSSPSARSSASA
jgi:hypothetical protein